MGAFRFSALVFFSIFAGASAHAEIELESGDSPLEILQRFEVLGDPHLRKTFESIFGEEDGTPLRWPRFKDPYEKVDDEMIEAMVRPLAAWSRSNIPSHLSHTIPSVRATEEANTVEVYLPENRCDIGFIKWGSPQIGYSKCRILGRGQAVFGNLRDMAGLKNVVKDYNSWVIGKLPQSVASSELKPQEHFSRGQFYDHCLYKPEEETAGASITVRPNSTIGQFLLDTGVKVHGGKDSWGRVTDSSKARFILPVRMNKIADSRNDKYKKDGSLIYRDDFFVHSHYNKRDDWPLQSQSTWGCPRLSRPCMMDFQSWVASLNSQGIKPRLIQRTNSERASNFDRE